MSNRPAHPGVTTSAVIAVLLLAILLAAGCSPAAEPDESSAAPQAAQTTAAHPRTITDAAGQQVTLPATPQRVLALSEPDLDAALALGVTPVGTLNGRGQTTPPRYLGERLSGIPVIGPIYQPDIEKVIQLRPDVILAGGYPDEQVVYRLRQVAPTVVTFRLGEDWKTLLNRVGTALNRDAEAAAFLAQYDRRVQETRSKLGPSANAVVSIARWNPQGPGYVLNDAFASRIVQDLGLTRPDAHQQAGVGHSPPLSLEALNQIDADWLFLGTLSTEGDAVKAMEAAIATPNFKSLNAVKSNHLVTVDGSLWTSLGGPLAALAVLDDIAKAMTSR